MTVQGDACGVDTLSRTLGAHAVSTDAQAGHYASALGSLPATSFRGGKAAQSRQFVSDMHAASLTAAKSYDRVASFLPRVSRAIDDAQRKEQALDKANTALKQANDALTKAQTEFTSASTAVQNAELRAAGTQALGLPSHGPTAAQQAALARAEQDLTRAEHELTDAQRDQGRAKRAFDDAERHRITVLNAFSRLCTDEAAQLDQAIPEPPPAATGYESFLTYLSAGTGGDYLHHEATALRELPIIAAFAPLHRGDLRTAGVALRARQPYLIDAITPHFQPLSAAPPTHPDHRSFLHKLGDKALHTAGDIAHGGGQLLDGVKDGVVGVGTDLRDMSQQALRRSGVYGFDAMMSQQLADQQAQSAMFHDPVGTAKNIVGYDDFAHHPLHAIGALIPTAVTAVATDGAASDVKAVTAMDKAARSTARFHGARAAATGDRAAADIAATARARSRALEPAINRARRTHHALEGYNTAGDVAGLNSFLQNNGKDAYGCAPYTGGGLLPGKIVGRGTSEAHEHYR
jgi:hypothetical protein